MRIESAVIGARAKHDKAILAEKIQARTRRLEEAISHGAPVATSAETAQPDPPGQPLGSEGPRLEGFPVGGACQMPMPRLAKAAPITGDDIQKDTSSTRTAKTLFVPTLIINARKYEKQIIKFKCISEIASLPFPKNQLSVRNKQMNTTNTPQLSEQPCTCIIQLQTSLEVCHLWR